MTVQPDSDNRVIPPSFHNDSLNSNDINNNNNYNNNNNQISPISITPSLSNRFSSFKSSPSLSNTANTISIATLNANGLRNSSSKLEFIIEELLFEKHINCLALQQTHSLESAMLPRFRNIIATNNLNPSSYLSYWDY